MSRKMHRLIFPLKPGKPKCKRARVIIINAPVILSEQDFVSIKQYIQAWRDAKFPAKEQP